MSNWSRWMVRAAVALTVGLALPAVPEASASPAAAPVLTKPPAIVRFVEAEYPAEERASGRAATVKLRIALDAKGKVTKVDVAESAGAAFDAAATKAALQFEFSPAEVDGKPSAIVIEYAYAFTIAVEEPPPPQTAGFAGVVVARGTGTPLAGVVVELRGEDGTVVKATTDEAGRFAFTEMPPGVRDVGLSGAALTSVRTRETLIVGEQLDVRYEVGIDEPSEDPEDEDDLEIVVVAPALQREATSTKVTAEEARKVPGTSGDVVRVVESLPGVGRSTAGSGALVVWGAEPQQTRIYVDGVPIPRLYHEGGLRSVVHPKLVDSLELIAGGQGAMWGRGTGGMVSITTLTPEGKRTGGRLHADILDASAVVTTPLDKKQRWHIALAARASYVAAWGEQLIDEQTAGLVPLPRYGDGQARVLYRPSSRDSVELVSIVSVDRFRRGVPNDDPALAIDDRRATDFGRLYMRWIHTPSPTTTLTVTPWLGIGRSRRASAVGPVTTSLSDQTVLGGLRMNRAWQPRPWVRFDAGVDAELDVVAQDRIGSLALPAREGDIRVFGQPPPDELVVDQWQVTRIGVAPYVQAELSAAKGKLRVIPGVRLDPYARAVDRRNPRAAEVPKVGLFEKDLALEPRIAVIAQPLKRLEIRGAAGLYRQAPAPEDLSATFGAPSLPTSKALHTVLGAKVSLTKTLSIDVTGFYARTRDIAMRSAAESPLAAQALVASGTGRTYGLQGLLRQDLWKGLFGWVAYTLMRAERRNREADEWRLSDYDQTHVLTAVLGWSLPRGFEIGGRFRYASGFPRTAVTGAWYDATRNRFQPELGEHNKIRIPQFMQLDLRAAKRWEVRTSAIEVFVEVLNMWNRSNAEELVYSADYARRGVISGFPVLPVAGLQWDF